MMNPHPHPHPFPFSSHFPVVQRRKGSRSQHEISEYTEKEKEKMAEIELRKLQQQFRIMVESRKSFGVKTQRQMFHQE